MPPPKRRQPSRQAVIRVGPDSATLRVRLLGDRLREQRAAAGLTLSDVSKRLRRGISTLARWEAGERIAKPADLHYLLGEIYGVSARVREEIMQLADEALEAPTSGDVSMAVADSDWLNRRAVKIETFQDSVVPDLLQTPDYARAVLHAWNPGRPRVQTEQLLAARVARQTRLTGKRPLTLSAVVGEAALLAGIGGPEVRRAQLRHLLDKAALRNVELRVLPLNGDAHPGLAGPFEILRFNGTAERGLALVGTRGGDIFFEDMQPFEQALRRIRSAALSHRESVVRIAALAKEQT